jgi:hemerythrin-like domain-containing protein
MSTASEALRAEHRSIRDALEVLEEICFLLRAEQEILSEDIVALTDFLRVYTHDLHQKKEELFLFPALERAGVSRDESHFVLLLSNHELGQVYLRHLVAAGRNSFLNREEFVEAAESYIKMESAHIVLEDSELLRLADERLDGAEQARLIEEFDQYECQIFGTERIDEAEHVLEYFRIKYMDNND